MVRVGYFKFYKWNDSGHSKIHNVNDVGIGAEEVLESEKVKRSTYLPPLV